MNSASTALTRGFIKNKLLKVSVPKVIKNEDKKNKNKDKNKDKKKDKNKDKNKDKKKNKNKDKNKDKKMGNAAKRKSLLKNRTR